MGILGDLNRIAQYEYLEIFSLVWELGLLELS